MKKVYIIGYYGYQNAGDDAMLMGLCNELNNRGVPYKFYLRGDSASKVLSSIWQADIVALGGGTHLRNWGKNWLWQGLRIILLGLFVRLLGKEFHMWNVGIDGSRWERIARKIASFISIRDRETFDSAVLMDWKHQGTTRPKILGINITPVNTIYHNNFAADWGIWKAACKAAKEWCQAHNGMVRFISLNSHKNYSDEIIPDDSIAKLFDLHFEDIPVEIVPYQDNPVETLNKIAECTAMIGMRYHANVFAYMAGVPIWRAIDSYPSVSGFHAKYPLEVAKTLARKGIKTE